MANRYRRNTSSNSRRSRSSGGSLTSVLILLGIVIGILLTSAGYMFFSKRPAGTKTQSNSLLVKTSEKSTQKEKAKETAQRFEFYTLLPGMEVQLPDAPPNTSQANQSHKQSHKKHEPVNVLVQPLTSRPIPQTASKETEKEHKSRKASTHSDSNKMSHTSHASTLQTTSSSHTEPSKENKNTNVKDNLNGNADSKNSIMQGSAAQYILQAGIFQELTLADELKAKLTLQGFNTRIQKVQTQEGQTWFRVTLGPFASESNALQQKKRLENQKIHGILILQRPNT